MALFSKKTCCHCGGKVKPVVNAKLADGEYICGDCWDKCGLLVSLDTFETKVRKEDVPAIMESHRIRTERAEQFQVTTSILNGQGSGILVDENHGWWIPLSNKKWATEKSPEKALAKKKPPVFELSQYLGYEMKLCTSEQGDDWTKWKDFYDNIQLLRPDFPTCGIGERISDIELYFALDDPYVTKISIFGLKHVKMKDTEEKMALDAYQLADDILTFLEQHQG